MFFGFDIQTKNRNETGPQGTDSSLDPELAMVFRREFVSGHPGNLGKPIPVSFTLGLGTLKKRGVGQEGQGDNPATISQATLQFE